jgi:hypothetical protein
MSDTSSSNSDVEEDNTEDLLPISSHVNVIHGLKSVSCLTLDSNGIRMITGGHDETMKMFDFTSMDKNFQPFRTIQPCPGRLLRAIQYSSNNDMILVIPGDCQAIVVNREGTKLLRNLFFLFPEIILLLSILLNYDFSLWQTYYLQDCSW